MASRAWTSGTRPGRCDSARTPGPPTTPSFPAPTAASTSTRSSWSSSRPTGRTDSPPPPRTAPRPTSSPQPLSLPLSRPPFLRSSLPRSHPTSPPLSLSYACMYERTHARTQKYTHARARAHTHTVAAGPLRAHTHRCCLLPTSHTALVRLLGAHVRIPAPELASRAARGLFGPTSWPATAGGRLDPKCAFQRQTPESARRLAPAPSRAACSGPPASGRRTLSKGRNGCLASNTFS